MDLVQTPIKSLREILQKNNTDACYMKQSHLIRNINKFRNPIKNLKYELISFRSLSLKSCTRFLGVLDPLS